MSEPIKRLGSLALVTMWVSAGCGGQDTKLSEDENGCASPTAEAGESRSAPLGTQVALNGTASSWCGQYAQDDVTFSWNFERVPSSSTVSEGAFTENKTSTASQPSFLPDIPGEYVVALRVSDPDGISDPDYVVISITSDDLPPVADCGTNTFGQVGQATQLDGSGSTDPEGARMAYTWSVSSAPACSHLNSGSVYDQGTITPSVIPDCQGLFVVSLVVDDGLQASEPAYCTIDVRSDNRPPVAETGTDRLIPPCTDNPFQLAGWESYDPDGDPLTYSWSVVESPADADPAVYGFEDATVVAPYFVWDVPGEWSFQLQVSDGHQWSSPDQVTHTVVAEGANNSPTADPGGPHTVLVEVDCTRDGWWGPWVCGECPVTIGHLDGSGSPDVDGDRLEYQWTELSGVLTWLSDTSSLGSVELPAMDASPGVDQVFEYDIQLDVSDCTLSDSATTTLTHICRGNYVY